MAKLTLKGAGGGEFVDEYNFLRWMTSLGRYGESARSSIMDFVRPIFENEQEWTVEFAKNDDLLFKTKIGHHTVTVTTEAEGYCDLTVGTIMCGGAADLIDQMRKDYA